MGIADQHVIYPGEIFFWWCWGIAEISSEDHSREKLCYKDNVVKFTRVARLELGLDMKHSICLYLHEPIFNGLNRTNLWSLIALYEHNVVDL